MRRTAALVAIGLLAACGGGGDDDAAPADALPTEGAIPCDDLYGMATADVLAEGACDNGEGLTLLVAGGFDCDDGRKLQWTDGGWGWSDGVWQAHARADGQLVPPDADMTACGH